MNWPGCKLVAGGTDHTGDSVRLRLIVGAPAFVTISSILALETCGASGVLPVTFQTFPVTPAATGRIVLAALRGDLADVAVFWSRCKKHH